MTQFKLQIIVVLDKPLFVINGNLKIESICLAMLPKLLDRRSKSYSPINNESTLTNHTMS